MATHRVFINNYVTTIVRNEWLYGQINIPKLSCGNIGNLDKPITNNHIASVSLSIKKTPGSIYSLMNFTKCLKKHTNSKAIWKPINKYNSYKFNEGQKSYDHLNKCIKVIQ